MSLLPMSPAPSSAIFTSRQPTSVSESQSLVQQARATGAQRWEFRFSWNANSLNKAAYLSLFSFCLAMRGRALTCQSVLPGHTTPQGSWQVTYTGQPLKVYGGTDAYGNVVFGNNNIACYGNVVLIYNATPNMPNAAVPGDFLQFSNHSKVYMITALSSSNSSGWISATFEPSLLVPVYTLQTQVIVNNIPFTLRKTSDSLTGNMSAALLYGIDIDFVEAF